MIVFYAMITALVLVLMWLTRVRMEHFVDAGGAAAATLSLEGMPTPPELFKRARNLLEKYDRPELWTHAALVMDKDPGQLARMNLGINN